MTTQPSFQISALPMNGFAPLFDLDDDELRARGARRYVATSNPGFPCRVSLQDAEVGETLILVPYDHHPVNGPYRASGPIFVREQAEEAQLAPGEVPALLRHRQLSVRGYSAKGLMVDAAVTPGEELEAVIGRLFGQEKVDYLHVHYAAPGCFGCWVGRG
ncbi:MAG: DUF1203 domain-containing protein [Acidobacteriota bacterium]|nr:DUF1203 domain-containing protein [Acidobacteriota bacterium]